jgi:hypothetical protein
MFSYWWSRPLATLVASIVPSKIPHCNIIYYYNRIRIIRISNMKITLLLKAPRMTEAGSELVLSAVYVRWEPQLREQ